MYFASAPLPIESTPCYIPIIEYGKIVSERSKNSISLGMLLLLFVFLPFLGPFSRHMEVPRLGSQLKKKTLCIQTCEVQLKLHSEINSLGVPVWLSRLRI